VNGLWRRSTYPPVNSSPRSSAVRRATVHAVAASARSGDVGCLVPVVLHGLAVVVHHGRARTQRRPGGIEAVPTRADGPRRHRRERGEPAGQFVIPPVLLGIGVQPTCITSARAVSAADPVRHEALVVSPAQPGRTGRFLGLAACRN
jgi:hypothetical protein